MEMEMINSKRRGVIIVQYEKRTYEEMVQVFNLMKFLPVRAESLYEYRAIEYRGFSPLFDEVPDLTIAPEYELEIEKYKDETGAVVVTGVTCKKTSPK